MWRRKCRPNFKREREREKRRISKNTYFLSPLITLQTELLYTFPIQLLFYDQYKFFMCTAQWEKYSVRADVLEN